MNQIAETMSTTPRNPAEYRSRVQPIWCPGCGDYSVLLEITKALAALELPPEQVAIVSGIGCSSRFPAYSNCYGFHGIHGRALPLATGLKVARPELTVITTGGDGDGFSIGGNHFLHACRRNVDITYIVMDNQVYGMTKGQASPTTDPDWDSVLTPGGTGIRPFQPLVIALASGANFVARAFAGDPEGTTQIIIEGIKHPGFSFIQILSPCVTFRPEQREWRNQVRPAPVPTTGDPSVAAKRIMTDDGFNLGILYAGDRPSYQTGLKDGSMPASELGREFVL
ncbi:MAG: 2-oxoglutarate oxidoreductase, beta subunit [Gammaproteobacteria bacterium]|nr:2-oxoglutarate oxidoreductase, beta subunit [Gammaproteobacteria bacterium]